jgi:hypothetical protein
MTRLKGPVLAASLLAVIASGCSQSQPSPKNFTLAGQIPPKAAETENTLEVAERACKAETRRKGMASIVGIFSRLRPGSADANYIACMKTRGYEVKS